MPITLNSNFIQVTYTAGDTKGDSAANPYTLQDVYDKDIAEGWGYVTKIGSTYIINGRGLDLNSAQYFQIASSILSIVAAPGTYGFNSVGTTIWDFSYSIITCFDKPLYIRQRGSAIKCSFISYSSIYFGGATPNFIGIDCSFYTISSFGSIWYYGDCDLTRVSFNNFGGGFFPRATLATSENIIISSSGVFINDFVMSSSVVEVVKLIKSDDILVDVNHGLQAGNYNIILTDCIIDYNNYTVSGFVSSQAKSKKATYKTTIKGTINNGAGATLTIKSQHGDILHTEVLTTDDITEHKEVYAERLLFNEVGDPTYTDQLTENQPFTITITKEGYQDLTISDITVTPGEPTIIRGELVEVEPPIYVDAQLSGSITETQLSGVVEVIEIGGTI